jgi:hypothetical protein
MLLRYLGPGHVLDVSRWGYPPVRRGETVAVKDGEGRALLADPRLRLVKVGDDEPDPVFRLHSVDRRGVARIDYKPRKRGDNKPEADSGEGQEKQEE